MNLVAHLGPALKRHRELLRLSQEELAHRAGLDRTYISGMERGRRNPTVAVLQRVSTALGVDLDVLFATARQIAVENPERG